MVMARVRSNYLGMYVIVCNHDVITVYNSKKNTVTTNTVSR